MLKKYSEKILRYYLKSIALFLREDENDEVFIKKGFIVTTLYMWGGQAVYCSLIGLKNVGIACGSAFFFQALAMLLQKKKIIPTKLFLHLVCFVVAVSLNFCYLNAGAGSNPTVIWLGAVPILSVTLLGVKAGGLWSLLSAAMSVSGMILFEKYNIEFNEWNDWHVYNVGMSNLYMAPFLFFSIFSFYSDNRRKMLEKISSQTRIIQNEKREKEKLLGVLFHDLGRSTSLMSGYLELSQKQVLTEENKSKVITLLEQIKNILKNAKDLDSESVLLRKEAVCCGEVFESLKKMFDKRLKEKGISLIFNGEKSLKLNVNTAQMINHVLGNLVSNAIKFSPSGSIITFEVREGKLGTEILISDKGIGYVPNVQRAGTQGEKGDGMGLKIAQQFATLNGFNIKIERNIGNGTVCILVPFS